MVIFGCSGSNNNAATVSINTDSEYVSGEMVIDYNESETVQYLSLNHLPDLLTDTDKEFINHYISNMKGEVSC